MRAAFYDVNGKAADVLQVGEVPTPAPGPGEVRVKLKTSGVNPSDVKGRLGLTRKMAFPRVIPHSDGAGEIDAVGDGVPNSRVGERVWIWNGQWKRAFGTAAEYIAVPQRQAVPLPANVGFDVGAGLGIPAITARYAVTVSGANKGSTVFIPAGAGAVAFYAIQFAKAEGMTVITTVSSAEKRAVAQKAGADHIIDYKKEDVAARIAGITGGKGVDAVLEMDLGVNSKLWPAILHARSSVVVYGVSGAEQTVPAQFCLTSNINIRFILVYEMTAEELDAAIAQISAMLAAGKLVHNIATALPLDRIVAAHETVENGAAIGKVVVTIA
jgi:NADPH2:quinone reductase